MEECLPISCTSDCSVTSKQGDDAIGAEQPSTNVTRSIGVPRETTIHATFFAGADVIRADLYPRKTQIAA